MNRTKWIPVGLLAVTIYLNVGCQDQGVKEKELKGFKVELAEIYTGEWLIGAPGTVSLCWSEAEAEKLRKTDGSVKACSHMFIGHNGEKVQNVDNDFLISDYPEKGRNRKFTARINENGDLETSEGLKMSLDKTGKKPALIWMGEEYSKEGMAGF